MHLVLKSIAQWADDTCMRKDIDPQWRATLQELAAICRKVAQGL